MSRYEMFSIDTPRLLAGQPNLADCRKIWAQFLRLCALEGLPGNALSRRDRMVRGVSGHAGSIGLQTAARTYGRI
jgi:hypothetical protein